MQIENKIFVKILLCSCNIPHRFDKRRIRECLHDTRNEISFRLEKMSIYITFHCGRSEM